MRAQVLCFILVLSQFVPRSARAEGGEVLLEALGPSSEVAGPFLVEMASYTLADTETWLYIMEPEVLGAVLLSGVGVASTGYALEGMGAASARRRYRDAAVEGTDRLSANDPQPISHSGQTSSLRQVAQWEGEYLKGLYPDRVFGEDQLTAIIIAKSRYFEANLE